MNKVEEQTLASTQIHVHHRLVEIMHIHRGATPNTRSNRCHHAIPITSLRMKLCTIKLLQTPLPINGKRLVKDHMSTQLQKPHGQKFAVRDPEISDSYNL